MLSGGCPSPTDSDANATNGGTSNTAGTSDGPGDAAGSSESGDTDGPADGTTSGEDASTESGSGTADGGGSTTGSVGCGAPVELGTFVPTAGDARGMAVSGNTVFVAVTSGGLEAVDITDPAAPTSIGVIDFDPGQLAFTVALADDHAVVGQRGAGLKFVDITDPANMLEVAADDTDDAQDVAIEGTTLYVVDGNGIRTYDITDPAAPAVLSATVVLPGSSNAIAVDGQTAYVAASGGGLVAVDVSDPAEPVELSTFATPANATHVAVSDAAVFVSHADGVHVVDMTDPTTPQLLGWYERERAHAVAVADDALFVLGDDTASTAVPFLAIVDVGDPSLPTALDDTFDAFADPFAVLVDDSGRLLFTVEDDDALHIVDPCPTP